MLTTCGAAIDVPEIVLVASGLPFQGAFTSTPCIKSTFTIDY